MQDGIDIKMIRINNVLGSKPRPLTKENIIMQVDPDISISSKNETLQKKLAQRASKSEFAKIAIQLPNSNKQYIIKDLGETYDIDTDELDLMIPKTADELIAEDENIKLSKGIKVEVKASDNHLVHLRVNSSASDTIQTKAHLWTHREALKLAKVSPDALPAGSQDPNAAQGQAPGQGMPVQPATQSQASPIDINTQS